MRLKNYYNRNDYQKTREMKTGYFLTQSEIDKLSEEEKKARIKFMLESREYIKRLKDLDEELTYE